MRPHGHLSRARRSLLLAAGVGLAWAAPNLAAASPGIDGTRNLSLGSVSRSSSFGTNAALINPSNMNFQQVFAIEPMYQFAIQSRTHGVGLVVMDSLNNSRVSIGLGYLFLRGKPEVRFQDDTGEITDFELSRFGHEVPLSIGIAVVKRWLSFGIKPKYQYASLRYRNVDGSARNAHDKLNAFGLDLSATANFAGWAALSVVGTNLVGNHSPPFTDERDVRLTNVGARDEDANVLDHDTLPELSEYPLGLAHGVSVFPLRNPDFSLNFDGTYDFTTFRFEKATRLTYGGSAEFVAGPVPLRFGTVWDGRGKGRNDDRVFVAGGIAYVKPAKVGGLGVDVGFGFQQGVSGPKKETVLGLNLGIRLHPDL